MGRNRLPNQFGKINDKLFNKLSSKQRQPIAIYNKSFKQLEDIENQLEDYEIIIENLKKDREKIRRRCEKIYTDNKHLTDDYLVSYNISKNDRYTSIRQRKGFNTEGKSKTQLLKERKFIGRYWLVNIKYRGKTKSIHIGNDDYVKEYIKNDAYIKKEAKDTFGIKDLNKLSEGDIKDCMNAIVGDAIYEIISSGENILDKKLKFTDLV